ncbi:MAG: YHS domain-containing protein [bacterium]
MPEVRDPVCGMTFPEEEAEALGAFVLVRGGAKHYFCSSTCKEQFERRQARAQ